MGFELFSVDVIYASSHFINFLSAIMGTRQYFHPLLCSRVIIVFVCCICFHCVRIPVRLFTILFVCTVPEVVFVCKSTLVWLLGERARPVCRRACKAGFNFLR